MSGTVPLRVAVVIATYKRPDALKAAIFSALAQTEQDIEVVVAIERDDDLSPAAVAEVADPRVRLVVNPERGGPGIARDLGARSSAAAWIAFLDDDDAWEPTKLERQLAVAEGKTIVTCLSRVVGVNRKAVLPTRPYDGARSVGEWLFDRQTWLGSGEAMLQTSSLMMPRALFDVIGFGRSRHEEWELVIRATAQHGHRLVTVPEVLVTYYEGWHFSWKASLPWAESMVDVLPPRALAGFCLNSAVQAIKGKGRMLGYLSYLRAAFRLGRPTAKQLFAFGVMWATPPGLRRRLRQIISLRPR